MIACPDRHNLIRDLEGPTPEPEAEIDHPSDIDHDERHVEPLGREFFENLNPLKV